MSVESTLSPVSIGCSLVTVPLFPCDAPHRQWTFVLLSGCICMFYPLSKAKVHCLCGASQGNSLWIQGQKFICPSKHHTKWTIQQWWYEWSSYSFFNLSWLKCQIKLFSAMTFAGYKLIHLCCFWFKSRLEKSGECKGHW